MNDLCAIIILSVMSKMSYDPCIKKCTNKSGTRYYYPMRQDAPMQPVSYSIISVSMKECVYVQGCVQ